jgi:putative endonuclease
VPEVVRMNAKDALGQQGEQLAARFLAEAGLLILDRNWRCKHGEIDIVALDGRTLVICEVKTRSGLRFGSPIEAITRQKAWRLRKLAVLWVNAHGLIFGEIRIDAVGVLRVASGDFTVDHVRGVG